MEPSFCSETIVNVILYDSGRTQKQLLECMGSGEKKHSHFDRSDLLDVPCQYDVVAGVFFPVLNICPLQTLGKDRQMFMQRKD